MPLMSTSEASASTRGTDAEASGRRLMPSWIGDIAQAGSLTLPVRLLAARLHQEIAGGSITHGSLLPAARLLRQLLGVADETVQTVMRVLADEAPHSRVSETHGTAVRFEKESTSATAAGPLGTMPGPALYQQIAFDLREQIAAGSLAQGEKMPSGRELERRYGVASMTARRALQILRDEGLIQAVGRGNVVTGRGDDSPESVEEEAPEAGVRHTVSTITATALDELYAEVTQLRHQAAAQRGVAVPEGLTRPTPH